MVYILGGIGAAILVCLIYLCIIKEKNGFITNLRKTLYSFQTKKLTKTEEAVQGKIAAKKLWLYITIPVICIAIAELLIFSGRMAAGLLVHAGILISLSLSNNFIKDPRIHKIFMPLMLLPLLRLINLSMPVFFEPTLYTFILYYSPLAIPVAAIIIHQRNSLEEIGITTKNFLIYIVISVPLGFMLGFGEYEIIQPEYLIPNLTFVNILKLTIVMVFFVGLVEELIFRSILQVRLEQTLGVWGALIITSLLFGLMHSGYGTFNEILYAGVVGLFMGALFHKTKSLPFMVSIHSFINIFLYGILPFHL